ncbi:hypothetical protein ANANG_G00199860 [Anguilla anguilla]|uniref:Uncharacterized protein n=1 Tax=Anguilla anguilla TaxID=7936 RepID=A0A9D3M654_ANGAN|nr:hypothetical protein ANANG_G00199860 [Anguilla anguilla]
MQSHGGENSSTGFRREFSLYDVSAFPSRPSSSRNIRAISVFEDSCSEGPEFEKCRLAQYWCTGANMKPDSISNGLETPPEKMVEGRKAFQREDNA